MTRPALSIFAQSDALELMLLPPMLKLKAVGYLKQIVMPRPVSKGNASILYSPNNFNGVFNY